VLLTPTHTVENSPMGARYVDNPVLLEVVRTIALFFILIFIERIAIVSRVIDSTPLKKDQAALIFDLIYHLLALIALVWYFFTTVSLQQRVFLFCGWFFRLAKQTSFVVVEQTQCDLFGIHIVVGNCCRYCRC
jgi:hypothetical protein